MVALNNQKTWINVVQLIGDAVILNIAILFAFILRFQGFPPANNLNDYISVLPWITLTALFFFNFYGLYNTRRKLWSEIFASLVCSLFFVGIISFVFTYLFQVYAFPRSVLLISPLMQFIMLTLWRYAVHRLECKLRSSRKAIVIGETDEAYEFAKKLKNTGNGGYDIKGIIIKGPLFTDTIGGFNVLGKLEDTKKILMNIEPEEVYVCSEVDEKTKKIISSICLAYPWRVYIIPNLYDILVAQSKLDQVDDTPVFEVGAPVNHGSLQVKRFIDLGFSLAGLILTLPLMILVAVAIKLDSPGPVFYMQERISEKGRKFKVIKFRTMVNDAEKKTGPVLSSEEDPRVTRVGKFLRATRIDEIPQLINVLKGEMSLVGPRPERPYFVEQFVKEMPEYNFRHSLKSGITGLAQIAGKYSTSAEDKLRYDLLYSKSVSPLFDLQILMQTVKVILMRNKAS